MPLFMINNGLLKLLCQIIATTCDLALSRYIAYMCILHFFFHRYWLCDIIRTAAMVCDCQLFLCRNEKELILTDVLHFCKLVVIYSIRYAQVGVFSYTYMYM